jgi:hypothetical protein
MVTDDDASSGELPQAPRNIDAVFAGWQTTRSGESFALYTITAADHPSRGSTVTDKSLMNLNLKIPQTPGRPVNKP